MSIELLYVIAAVLPVVLMPILLPMVVLMAHRKHMTDSPNARKLQDRPVVVMGGTVIVLIMCVTMIVVNLFYDISNLFLIVCVMVVLYIIGMLDDNINLEWQFKAVTQVVVVLLLFFGGSYGVHSLFGFMGIGELPIWMSFLLSLFIGLILVNAVNFVDGIDGLASLLGVLSAVVMIVWNIRHFFIDQAIFSFIMLGVLSAFFIYNVFSIKYKSYMGDSGSLVLGLYVYMSACPATYHTISDDLLADRYFVSFIIALFSAMIFDFVRVVLTRIFNGKSPFHPDRNHLHHVYVDLGMSHLLTAVTIVLCNILVILVWYFTAKSGMNSGWQFVIVVAAGLLAFWLPFYLVQNSRDHHPEKYMKHVQNCKKICEGMKPFMSFMNRIVDGRKRGNAIHKTE